MAFIFETPAGSLFDYTAFIEEGYEDQQKYDNAAGRPGPLDEVHPMVRYAKVIEYIGHMIEETVEARMCVPRRSWKTKEESFLDNTELRKEFCMELYDVLLFHRAILAYAGISSEEFCEAIKEKTHQNSTRKDHKTNG